MLLLFWRMLAACVAVKLQQCFDCPTLLVCGGMQLWGGKLCSSDWYCFSWWILKPWPHPVQTASVKQQNPGWTSRGKKTNCHSSASWDLFFLCFFPFSNYYFLPYQFTELVPESSLRSRDFPVDQNDDRGPQHRLVFTLSEEVLTWLLLSRERTKSLNNGVSTLAWTKGTSYSATRTKPNSVSPEAKPLLHFSSSK